MKPLPYIIIEATSPALLQAGVCEKVNEAYEPHGSMLCYPAYKDPQLPFRFAQPMVYSPAYNPALDNSSL